MRRVVLAFGLFVVSWPGAAPGAERRDARPLDLARPWAIGAPAEAGLDGHRLALTADRAARIPRLRSLLVARHGTLVLERYFAGTDAQTRFDVRSVTKSVVGALAGVALHEGALRGLDEPLGRHLSPEYALDEADRAITARQLLTMTSGYEWAESQGPDYRRWIEAPDRVQFLLDRPRARRAGTRFAYNSAAAHLLGVVLERAAGRALADYAQARLFDPLGIRDARWEALEHGTVNGGSGLALRARELLKFGQLFLQRGWSGDRSVVPAGWVDETVRPQFAWRSTIGGRSAYTYGMLWWVSDDPQAFFALGHGGQLLYVVPALDLVAVATTDWRGLTPGGADELAEQTLGLMVDGVVPSLLPAPALALGGDEAGRDSETPASAPADPAGR